jgi:hypothetical protein
VRGDSGGEEGEEREGERGREGERRDEERRRRSVNSELVIPGKPKKRVG